MLIISPHIISPKWTDFRSIASMLASGRLAARSGEELAVAVWRLLVDKAEGFYHYCPAVERLTGHFVYDPVKLFNVFGWSICGVTANTLAVLYADAGFQAARIPRLKGHEATEVSYDGAWHLFDGDLQAYHRRHPPEEGTIASYADCLADPTLISRQRDPSDPYYLPDRPPLAVTHEWQRADGRPARHVERIPSPDRPHAYTVTCGPSPRLERVLMQAASLPRAGP